MVVNKDYENWHIAYYCQQSIVSIKDYVRFTYCIIHDNNKYIEELVKLLPNITLIESTIFIPATDIYIICCHIEAFDYAKISLYNKKIIDVYQTYLVYESPKVPVNYIVDEYRETENFYKNYVCQKDLIASEYLQYYIKSRYTSNNQLKLFNKIEIETINRCNNTCEFCPVNHNIDNRPFKIMDDELYKDIINQLARIEYSGAIGLFSNNEPLLDKKIVERCQVARDKLPYAYLYIYTNGILLNVELLCQLLKHLDYIYIDNYNTSKELIPPLEPVYQYLMENEIDSNKISIHMRNQKEILSTRAGNAPNSKIPAKINSRCILPFSQMIIQSNGKVSLCSNDALGQVILGNVKIQSLEEIWYSAKYEKIRTKIQLGRNQIDICHACDAIFTPLPFERINNDEDE